jgi:hypothetical protein
MKTQTRIAGAAAAVAAFALAGVIPVEAHHSFAMYNMSKVQVFTGVVDGIDPAPNHMSINFAVMNDERNNVIRDADNKPIIWAVEMSGSAAMARQGVTVNAWPRGTVFSVALHPLRNDEPGGSREGAMFRCPDGPDGSPIRPEFGRHCDSVDGHIVIGGRGDDTDDARLPEPTQ